MKNALNFCILVGIGCLILFIMLWREILIISLLILAVLFLYSINGECTIQKMPSNCAFVYSENGIKTNQIMCADDELILLQP